MKPLKETYIDKLFKKQKELKKKPDKESKTKLLEIEEELATKVSEDFYNIVNKEVKVVESEESGFNS